MALFGFGETRAERAVRKAGERMERRYAPETRRIKEREAAVKAEARRKADIEHARKKTQLYKAQAEERESYTRKRRATQEARGARFGRLPPAPKVSKRTKRAIGRGVTRKRGAGSKIGWL
ncbi:hypothetical protein LCGC14_1486750 [marine sediment metagenome]|uniref:Uncharacterized protein n=1 Tax=marine sediment metagenome TaxID=412755 RepID=A0A0F9J8N4_9ZZZZ